MRLSSALDVDALAAAFAAKRRLRIPGLMDDDSAEAVAVAMEVFDNWRISVAASGELFELPLLGRIAAEPDKQSWIDGARIDGNSPRMQYIFDTRRLTVEGFEDTTPDAVSEVPAFLNSPEFIAFVRAVTGDDRIDFADAQATRYRPGHALTAHTDVAPGKNRLYAYVLNMTREWYADWGGALIFFDGDGHIADGFVPSFNTLNIFAVPKAHAVGQVASFAPKDRLSITGWLRSNEPIGDQP
nr:2OG-Fe(II) oxygenase family protein [Brevundimonas lenta]